jgi:hypothetical protein
MSMSGRNGAARACTGLAARAATLSHASSSSKSSRSRRLAVLAPCVIVALALVAVVMPAAASAATCTTTVSSVAAASSAVTSAATGSTICLTDGSYGRLSLSASKTKPGVTVQAQNPGGATLAGATMAGSWITLAQFKIQAGSVNVQPTSTGMKVDHNLMIGNRSGYAVYVCPGTTTVRCNDVAITNNRIQGSFNEDQIQANLYHDADGDGNGLLIEGNEFVGNVEWGNHDDVFQTVWVGDHLTFRKNYLHDFGGQGFFVKDQAAAIDGLRFEDNLLVRQNLPCDPTSLCPTWQLGAVQIFGPVKNVSIRHNTIWPGSGGGTQWLRGSGWGGPTVNSDNVFSNLNSDASGLTTGYTASNDTYCGGNGMPSTGQTSDCNPAFVDPASNDYRQANGRGVTWRVADQRYGPGGTTTTTTPPADTTAPTTTITAGMGATTSTSASFAFTSNEAGTFQCKLDAAASAPCASPKAYSGLTVGSHAFTVRAIDPAGNTDASPATQSWTISAPADTTAPNTTITSAPANPTTSTSPSFSFTSTESASTFACKLDAAAYAACTSAKAYTGSALGSHTFSVRATDAAGNMDASAATNSWMINSTTTPVDHQPIAAYVYSPTAPVTGSATTFDASTATCVDTPCTYTWTDDGNDGAGGLNWAVGSGKVLAFAFQGAGTKNIRLTVKDVDGDVASTVKAVTVRAASTAARFTR